MHLQKECRTGKAKVAVARVSCILKVSAGAHVPQSRATEGFWNGEQQWKTQCGCGSSFVHLEGVRGGGSNHCSFMLGSSPVHILRRDN